MKRLVIYDLDGTLVDTSQDLRQANAYVLSHLGVSPRQREALFAAYYAHHAYEHSRLYPGVRRVLAYFHGRSHQALLTDRPNPFARDLVEALGISGYFFDLVAGDSPYPRKPHPTGALALIAKAGVTPAETLLVGDSPLDIETGRNAGVVTIAVSQGMVPMAELRASGPDVLADDFVHLLELATRYGW